MNEYIKEIEQIAAKCTESQSDGYSQIMRICDAMREQQKYCLGYISKEEREFEKELIEKCIAVINELPNCTNGHSDVYDKATIERVLRNVIE